MSLESMVCPKCGAPLNFTEDQEYCFCSHCGTQVYKEDTHFESRVDLKKHKLDKETEIKLKKMEYEEHNKAKWGSVAVLFIIVALAMLMIFIVGSLAF